MSPEELTELKDTIKSEILSQLRITLDVDGNGSHSTVSVRLIYDGEEVGSADATIYHD